MSERVRRGRGPIFAQVPEELLFDPAISPNGKTAYGILYRFVDNRPDSDTAGAAFPGRQRIAEYMGKSIDTIDRALKELERSGWIDVERPAGGANNLYTVHALRSDAELVRTDADQRSAHTRTSRSAHTRTTDKESNVKESNERNAASAPQNAGASGGSELSPQPTENKPASKPKGPLRLCAEEIASYVYDHRDPRPATPYIAWVKIFETLLALGHDPETVRQAAMTASTISFGAMEVEIDRMKPRRNSSNNGRLQGEAFDDALRAFAVDNNIFGQGAIK